MNAEQKLIERLNKKVTRMMLDNVNSKCVDSYSIGYASAIDSIRLDIETMLECYEHEKKYEEG